MRTGAITGARAVLLGGPVALAFFSGGYFDEPRVWAGLLVWIVTVLALALGPRPLTFAGRGGRLALLALGALAAWTLVSFTWAPIAGDAYHAGQRVVLYAGGLLAAAVLLRGSRTQRAVVPALALGTLVVVGYGISERLLPGALHFARSISAQGRLEQPLTYWNAMGELAAIGVVLCVSLAGGAARPVWLRAVGAAATAPLGVGLYLSFSRGALFAGAAGLVALVTLTPRREQLHSIALAIVAAGLATAVVAPFHGVASLRGTLTTREDQGLIVLLALLAIGLLAAGAQIALARKERGGDLPLPRRAALIALVVICAGLAVAIVVGAKENSRQPLSGGATRYETLQSNRYDYWRVALRAFGDQPLRGVGAGGWAVYWLRYRHLKESARDAHSLPLQTLAELGLVGLALLLAFLGGIARTARDALARAPELAAGPTAGFIVWLAHAPLDWDWEMPAVTLVAIALAGALIGLANPDGAAVGGTGEGDTVSAVPSA